MVFAFLLYFAFVVFMIASQWKVYTKSGRPGWACLIPIYNVYILLKIGGKPGWWLLMFLVPLANIVFAIWTINMVSKSFGKDEGFTVGLILLPFIFYPILGFGSASYLGPYGDRAAWEAARNPQFDFEQNK